MDSQNRIHAGTITDEANGTDGAPGGSLCSLVLDRCRHHPSAPPIQRRASRPKIVTDTHKCKAVRRSPANQEIDIRPRLKIPFDIMRFESELPEVRHLTVHCVSKKIAWKRPLTETSLGSCSAAGHPLIHKISRAQSHGGGLVALAAQVPITELVDKQLRA